MGELVRLDTKLVTALTDETIDLMHDTRSVAAIKLLVSSHDILFLNLELLRLFAYPTWDNAALQELDSKRSELLVKYHFEFNPSPRKLFLWSKRIEDLQKLTA